jgi:hypothetical protein
MKFKVHKENEKKSNVLLKKIKACEKSNFKIKIVAIY